MTSCLGKRISKEGEIIDYGVKLDIVDKSGAWLSYQDKKLGQGRENAKALLKKDKALADEITLKIKESIGSNEEIMPLPDEPLERNGIKRILMLTIKDIHVFRSDG